MPGTDVCPEKYILEHQDFFARIPKSAVDVIDACTNIKDIREVLEYTLNPETGEEEADALFQQKLSGESHRAGRINH